MKIEINPESVAMLLAQKKVEKKYESLGFSPYESTYEEMIGLRYTPHAEKDYDKHYKYFLEILLSKELITHKI